MKKSRKNLVCPQLKMRLLGFRIAGEPSADQVTDITTIADTGALEVQRVTLTNTAGAGQAHYCVLSNQAGVTYAFWLDIDANGTVPTGAAYVAATNKVRVGIATGNTAAQNGAALAAAAAVMADVTILDNANGTVDFTQDLMGNTAAPARHNADDSGNGSIVVATITGGVASNLNSTYFDFSTALDENLFRVWMNVNGEGVAPAGGGRTLIPVILAAGATANQVGTALRLALTGAADGYAVGGATNHAIITNDDPGETTAAADGAAPTGFNFAVTTVGYLFAQPLEGFTDATLLRNGVGDYTLTFAKAFARVPIVSLGVVTANTIAQVVAVSETDIQVRTFLAADGVTAQDADFHLMACGNMDADAR